MKTFKVIYTKNYTGKTIETVGYIYPNNRICYIVVENFATAETKILEKLTQKDFEISIVSIEVVDVDVL